MGRFFLRSVSFVRGDNNFPDPNDKTGRGRFILNYFYFLSVVWLFAVGIFIYRTRLIFYLREWVAESGGCRIPRSRVLCRVSDSTSSSFPWGVFFLRRQTSGSMMSVRRSSWMYSCFALVVSAFWLSTVASVRGSFPSFFFLFIYLNPYRPFG